MRKDCHSSQRARNTAASVSSPPGDALGRELTEAAVLRALCELWQSLRISPVAGDQGQEARWEMLRVQHRDALASAAATGQVTALSLLVSMYLQSVYAASSEEIEIFLSPVASRSRVREAVRGLSATRQIQSLSMDAQTYYFLENGLPEFAAPAVPAASKEEQPVRAVPEKPVWRPLPAQRKAQPPAAPLAAAKAEWKTRPRPAAQDHPAWKGASKPLADAKPWRQGDRGSRPPLPPGRSFAAPDGRRTEKIPGVPGERAAASRPGTRPDTRTAGRNSGPWKGGPVRDKAKPRDTKPWSAKPASPKPWARPGTGARPAQAEGRAGSAFRPAQRPQSRPNTGRPMPSRGPVPAGDSARDSGRSRDPIQGRSAGSAPARTGSRPPGPFRRAGSFRSAPGRGEPSRGVRPSGGAVRGPRSGPKSSPGAPAARDLGRSPGTTPGRFAGSAPAGAGSRPPAPFRRAGSFRTAPGPGGPPRGGRSHSGPAGGPKSSSGAPRNGRPQGAGRVPARGGKYDRPRPAGKAGFAANAGSNRKDKTPQTSSARPSKPWQRAASSPSQPGGKAGRPAASFGERKPARKKPEA